MATAFSALRKRVALLAGDWVPENGTSTSGAGNSGGTTVANTSFAGYGDEFFAGLYLLITSGTDIDAERMTAAPTGGFTSSTGTFTVVRAYSAQIAQSVTMEVHRYSNTDYLQALNNALEDGFGEFWYRRFLDESLVVDNWLANNSFNSAIAAANWVSSGSPTLTYNTQYKMGYGIDGATAARSIKIVAGASAGSVYQDVHAASDAAATPEMNVKEITGRSLTFGMWVYCGAADTARIRLDWDGTNFENHAYHSGKDQWEWQELSAAVPSTATRVRVICEVAANGTAYFDEGYLSGPHRYRYLLSSSMVGGPSAVYVHSDKDNPEAGYAPWPYWSFEDHEATRYLILLRHPGSGKRLQLRGQALLTALTSTGTSTTELDSPQIELLSLWAAVNLLDMQLGKAAGDEHARILDLLRIRSSQLESMKQQAHIRMPVESAMRFGSY